ncbi:MAG: acetyl-CoA carboxylase, carboxyltransferase subunit beta [Planctomycetota bacterium]|nr:acetyl-CoA carboxylase, carboxyltransferase subunit beta [Planctomycetota bacterium]
MGWKFRKKKDIPGGLWVKCPSCGSMLQNKKLQETFGICADCDHHFRIGSRQRIDLMLDEGSFQEFGQELQPKDPLEFAGYDGTLERSRKRSGIDEAVVVGVGRIEGMDVALGCLDFGFVGGSMGIVVGSRVMKAAEQALESEIPLLLVATSGGARMQEGALSLMQMARTSAAIACLGEAGLPFVSILADPCTGGVIASFAALGDVIIAEPGALIGFAGPRVIQTTIGAQLPDGFQRAEFLLEHGFIDRICPRPKLRAEVASCLRFLTAGRRSA